MYLQFTIPISECRQLNNTVLASSLTKTTRWPKNYFGAGKKISAYPENTDIISFKCYPKNGPGTSGRILIRDDDVLCEVTFQKLTDTETDDHPTKEFARMEAEFFLRNFLT